MKLRLSFLEEGVNPCQLARRTDQQTALEIVKKCTDLCRGSILRSRALTHGLFTEKLN